MSSELNDKQQKFVQEYLIDLNATQAYIRAGYSEKGADVSASRLLGNARIQAEITSRKTKNREKFNITQDMIHKELAKIAFSNMKDYASWGSGGVTLKDSHDVDGSCVQEVTEVRSTRSGAEGDDIILNSNIKFKLFDKTKALVELDNRLFGTPKQSIEISGSLTLEQVRANLLGLIDVTPQKKELE